MCGVVGVMGSAQASQEALQALMVLQHRGQDAAGLLVHDLVLDRFHLHRAPGLVNEALPLESLSSFTGTVAIGHTRYATTAVKNGGGPRELQPQFVNFPNGLGLAHNGNLVNASELKAWLALECRRHLLSDNDAEVLLNLLAEEMGREGQNPDPMTRLTRAVRFTMGKAQGGYAVVGVWGGQGLFAFRDPQGLRPLVLGKKGEGTETVWMVASETSALRFLDYQPVRDLAPGELLFFVHGQEPQSVQLVPLEKNAQCLFEWVYFSSAESTLSGINVYRARLRLGEKLAGSASVLIKEGRINPDVVVPVPDTSRPAAIALAEALGLPFRELLIKNRYVQRSFILPSQKKRENAVRMKLTVVEEEIRGKRVLLVDDSIVRGTTSRRLIAMLREAGASEVYLASTCPPITDPCFFGIDFPQREELIAANQTPSEMALMLGADAVFYQELPDLREALGDLPLCEGCLTGKYPLDVGASGEKFLQLRESSQRGQI